MAKIRQIYPHLLWGFSESYSNFTDLKILIETFQFIDGFLTGTNILQKKLVPIFLCPLQQQPLDCWHKLKSLQMLLQRRSPASIFSPGLFVADYHIQGKTYQTYPVLPIPSMPLWIDYQEMFF